MMTTLGSVFENGSGAPGLQTGRPTASLFAAPTQVLCHPASVQVEPCGQQVIAFGQQTASSYGQQPNALTENFAPHGVPAKHTSGDGGPDGNSFAMAGAITLAARNS